MTAPPSAPRAFDLAAALYLSDPASGFAAAFAWDHPARTWRRRVDDCWLPLPLARVVDHATAVLSAALSSGPDVPLVFRCTLAHPADVPALEAVTDWAAERAARAASAATESGLQTLAAASEWDRLHAERDRLRDLVAGGAHALTDFVRLRSLDASTVLARPRPSPTTPTVAPAELPSLITPAHRERLLAALSWRGVNAAVRRASGMAPCVYVPAAAPVEVDPRAWLAALPRVPGVVVLRSALYAAYCAALPEGAAPVYDRAFHALAVEVLGNGDARACRTERKGRRYYRDLALPDPSASAA